MDRLDEIWKDRFNSEDLPINNRMVPDDLVWENIADATVRKDKRKRWFWWIITAGLGLTVLILTCLSALGSSPNKQPITKQNTLIKRNALMSRAKNDDTRTKKEVKHLESPLFIHTLENNLNVEKQEIPTLQEKSLDKKGNNIAYPTNDSKMDIDDSINNSFNNPVYMDLNLKNTGSTNHASLKEVKNTESGTPKSMLQKQSKLVNRSFKNIGLLDKKPFFVNAKVIYLPSQQTGASVIIPHLTPDKKWAITAGTGLSYWQHKISNQYTEDLADFDFNYKDKIGILTSIKVRRKIHSKWAIETGLNYERVHTNSGHNGKLTYNTDDELSNTNSYALNVATPYGLIPTEFKLERDDNTNLDNETELLVDFYAQHTIHNFNVPLMVNYTPLGQIFVGKKLSIAPSLSLGLGFNYLSKIDNQFDNIETNHTAIKFNNTDYFFDKPSINQWHWDYRLSLGTIIGWQDNWSLIIDYQRITGINNLFQLNNYKTKINRQHLRLGLHKRF